MNELGTEMRFAACFLLFGCIFCLPLRAAAEDWKIAPVFTASESWTDNLFNEERDKKSDFVTRLIPAVSLDYQAARVDLDGDYALDYRYYANGNRGSEAVHFLDLRALFNYNEWAYLDVGEQFARVSLDSTRDYREESLFRNQSDRNVFFISPYIEYRPSARSTLKGGFRYVDTDYEESSGDDKKDAIFFLESTYDLSDRTTLRGGYTFIDEDSTLEDHRKQDLWVGLKVQAGKNSSVFGTVGYTWIEFTGGPEKDEFFWDFGVTHDFGLLLATAAFGVTYLEDPERIILRQENYRLALSRDWSRSRLSATVSVSDYYDVAIDELDVRRYGISSSFNHELGERWIGLAAFSADKFEEKFDDTWTRRLIGRLGLSYLFAEDLTGTLTYYWIDSHSPEQPGDRYETNQVVLEARKVF